MRARGLPSLLAAPAIFAAAALILAACSAPSGDAAGGRHHASTTIPSTRPTTTTTTPSTTTTTTPPTTTTTGACIPVSTWTAARLAAETVIVPAQETDPGSVAPEVGAGAGGVVLFGSSAPADLGSLLASLQAGSPGHVGALIMTDEEGGGIQRMANLVGSLPWPRTMAQSWSAGQITAQVQAVAARMASYGVRVDLAPVVDVDGSDVEPGPTNPDGVRSFSGTTSVVSSDGVAYMRGLLAGGVLPVLKHFPGLGGSSGNTDVRPAHTLPWPTLQLVGIPPFAAAIAAGAPAVMISNATVPDLTSLPASLSSAVITTELRGALGFRGLVMTDSLSAGAVSQAGYSVAQASVAALEAGSDMVMFTGTAAGSATEQQFQAVVQAIETAVGNGTLARSRLVSAAASVVSAGHAAVCPG